MNGSFCGFQVCGGLVCSFVFVLFFKTVFQFTVCDILKSLTKSKYLSEFQGSPAALWQLLQNKSGFFKVVTVPSIQTESQRTFRSWKLSSIPGLPDSLQAIQKIWKFLNLEKNEQTNMGRIHIYWYFQLLFLGD